MVWSRMEEGFHTEENIMDCDNCDWLIDLGHRIDETISYINLFAEELGVYFHQIKRRLKGEE